MFRSLSGDSDLAPVTTKLKELCLGKKVGILVPKGQSAMHLKQHADFFKKIQTKDLKKSLLPEQVIYIELTFTKDRNVSRYEKKRLLHHRKSKSLPSHF